MPTLKTQGGTRVELHKCIGFKDAAPSGWWAVLQSHNTAQWVPCCQMMRQTGVCLCERACCLSLCDSGFKQQSMSEQLNKQPNGRIFCLLDLFSNVWECQGISWKGHTLEEKWALVSSFHFF